MKTPDTAKARQRNAARRTQPRPSSPRPVRNWRTWIAIGTAALTVMAGIAQLSAPPSGTATGPVAVVRALPPAQAMPAAVAALLRQQQVSGQTRATGPGLPAGMIPGNPTAGPVARPLPDRFPGQPPLFVPGGFQGGASPPMPAPVPTAPPPVGPPNPGGPGDEGVGVE
jgi:hypothetical protein